MASKNRELVGSVNPILTTFATGYKLPGMIADLVCPIVYSRTETGTFLGFGKEGFKIYNTERALNANANQIHMANTHDTFRCIEHALETPIDYKLLKTEEAYGVKAITALKKRHHWLLSKAHMVKREYEVTNIIFNADYYAADNKVSLSGDACWSAKNTSDPLSDIASASEAVRSANGIMPNTLVLGMASWNALKVHPSLLGKITNQKNQFLTVNDLKEIINNNITKIIIGQGVYSDDSGTFYDLWDDKAALLYTPSAEEMIEGCPLHSVQIHQEGYPKVKEYAEKHVLTIEETQSRCVKNVDTTNGYLIINTVA